jgi:hypothetical protein
MNTVLLLIARTVAVMAGLYVLDVQVTELGFIRTTVGLIFIVVSFLSYEPTSKSE